MSIRGRGAGGNPANRFETLALAPEAEDEAGAEHLAETVARAPTQYLRDTSRSIIARNDSPDVGFDASINPYRGCEHGCIYCYARPTHEYLGFSAGLDFESRIMVKTDAPALLRRELAKKSWRPQVLAMSGVTDCYQPVERRLGLTRGCLEVLAEVRNPVGIVTKSQLILRDLDLLAAMAGWNGVSVTITVTSLDERLAATLEPRASRPAARLETIRRLAAAGVPVGANLAPVIPGLTETEIPALLAAVRDAGASFAGWTMLRLPWAVAPLFEEWLAAHFPARRERVLNRVRDVRGGDLYRAEFGERMKGTGIVAEQIEQLFAVHARRVGIARRFPPLATEHFVSPAGEQLDLLGGG